MSTKEMLCRGEPFGEDGHRSRYLLNANQALYHLSYSPYLLISGNHNYYIFEFSCDGSHEAVLENPLIMTDTAAFPIDHEGEVAILVRFDGFGNA